MFLIGLTSAYTLDSTENEFVFAFNNTLLAGLDVGDSFTAYYVPSGIITDGRPAVSIAPIFLVDSNENQGSLSDWDSSACLVINNTVPIFGTSSIGQVSSCTASEPTLSFETPQSNFFISYWTIIETGAESSGLGTGGGAGSLSLDLGLITGSSTTNFSVRGAVVNVTNLTINNNQLTFVSWQFTTAPFHQKNVTIWDGSIKPLGNFQKTDSTEPTRGTFNIVETGSRGVKYGRLRGYPTDFTYNLSANTFPSSILNFSSEFDTITVTWHDNNSNVNALVSVDNGSTFLNVLNNTPTSVGATVSHAVLFMNFTQAGSYIDKNVTIKGTVVLDVTPPNVTLVAPTPVNNSFSISIIQVFNLSIIEINLDTITLNFNGTNETGFVNDFGNFHSLTRNTMAEGLFTYQIHVNDTSGNEFVSDEFQFTVDNTSPIITYTLPLPDNTTIRTDLTGNIDIEGLNINLDIANLTIFNQTNQQIFQNVTSGLTVSTFTFVNSFSEIFTNQPDDNYTFRSCFIDDANSESCQEVMMELSTAVAPPAPPITAEVIFPLENASNIVGMIALFLIILGALGFRRSKK